LEKTTYPNYEVILVIMEARNQKTLGAYAELVADLRVRVVPYRGRLIIPGLIIWVLATGGGDFLLLPQ